MLSEDFIFCIISSLELFLVLLVLYDFTLSFYTIFRAIIRSKEGGKQWMLKQSGNELRLQEKRKI